MKKKLLSVMMISALMMTCLSGCLGGSNSKNTSEDSKIIKIWLSESISGDSRKQIKKFVKSNPELAEYNIQIKGVGEDDAANTMLTDVKNGADIYGFAQDQLARLVAAEALSPVSDNDTDWARENNDSGSIAAASIDDTLYGYPLTSDNGYFLYYDKSVISDHTRLENILKDCEKAGKDFCMEINNGWYQTSFFFGTGCKLAYSTDNQGNFIKSDVNYASPEGVAAMKQMIELSKSKAFKNTSSLSKASNCAAIIVGTWESEGISGLFGDNYACSKLPVFTENGKDYQMSGFGGFKLLGIKPQQDKEKYKTCQTLARFLSGEEMQLEHYKSRGWGPSNKNVQSNNAIKADPALSALADQLQFMIPQGQYPSSYWILSKAFGDSIISGEYDNATDQELMDVLKEFQAGCESYIKK